MLQKANLVLYKNQIAMITEAGDKFTIQYTNNNGKKPVSETQKVRDKDIIFLHAGPVTSLSAFDNQAAASDISSEQLQEVWDLLQDDATESHNLSEIADLLFGKIEPLQIWHLYSALVQSPLFQLVPPNAPAEPQFSLRTKEEAQKLANREADKAKELQAREEFILRLKKKELQLPQDGIFMGEVEALALGKTDKSKILKEAGITESPEKAHKLLLDTGVWPITRNPHPSRWGLSMQSASEGLSKPPAEERVEVAATAYAIDNSWSTDPDDAVCFDGKHLWIHIADPAATVLPDSKIDISARNRGATLYIPEGAARMLAEESLEDYALGLSPQSPALSFKIALDEKGSIEQVEILKTLVRVARLTYEQADEQREAPELKALFDIANKNIERRKAAEAVFIELPEVHISVDNNTVAIKQAVHTASSAMIREIMLLAGEAAARFAFKNAIPFPYVSQDKPEIPSTLPDGLAGQYRLRRSMRSRSVGITPSQHAGLGLAMYSQVTSPLRRYSDLVAHQQLRAFISGGKLLDKDKMLERISAGDAAASAAVKAERKSNLHWLLVYLTQNPDWRGDGIVVELKGQQATVLIPSLGQETIINMQKTPELNETILLRAGNINIPELTVSFIEENNP